MAIRFNHVDFSYAPKSPFQFDALHDINLVINRHSFTAVIGHTGSGKSTLVQHINALLVPTAGVVEVEDTLILPCKKKKYLRQMKRQLKSKKVSAEQKQRLMFLKNIVESHAPYKIKELRKKVGVVFQFPEYQLFEETVIKDVAFGPKNFGVNNEEALALAKNALTLVGIDESFYTRSPFELSGGEKRRVAIAGILALKPEILVLDEPTAGLDPLSAYEMMETFYNIYKSGTTIVLVTHDMDLVLRYASDVVVMKDGKIVEETTPQKLFANVKDEYSLEVPAFYAFMQALVQKGCPLDISKINTVSDLARTLKRLKEQG